MALDMMAYENHKLFFYITKLTKTKKNEDVMYLVN